MLPVGGIREKVTAAHRAGAKIVLIPEECQRDIDEIPQEVRDDLEIRLVKRVEDVWEVAFSHVDTGRNEVIG